MARFRRARRSRRASAGTKSHRRVRRGSSSDGNIVLKLAGAAAYGAGRSYVSGWMAPLTSKIPAGQYADNIAMGAAAFMIGKFFPMAKPVTNAALLVEAANIGQKLAGGAGIGSTTKSTAITVYGA